MQSKVKQGDLVRLKGALGYSPFAGALGIAVKRNSYVGEWYYRWFKKGLTTELRWAKDDMVEVISSA